MILIDEIGVAPDYAKMPKWKYVLLQIRLAKGGRISPKMSRYTVRFTDGTWGLFGPKSDNGINPLCWWKDTYITGTVKHKQVLRTTAEQEGLNILGSYGDRLVWVGPNEIMSTVSVY